MHPSANISILLIQSVPQQNEGVLAMLLKGKISINTEYILKLIVFLLISSLSFFVFSCSSSSNVSQSQNRYKYSGIISSWANPDFLLLPESGATNFDYFYYERYLTNASSGTSVLDDGNQASNKLFLEYRNPAFTQIKAKLFSDTADVILQYENRAPGDDIKVLKDISFIGANNPYSGTSDVKLTDILEPEIIASQYSDMNKLYPVIYNKNANTFLFILQSDGGYSKVHWPKLLDLNTGKLRYVNPPYENIKDRLSESTTTKDWDVFFRKYLYSGITPNPFYVFSKTLDVDQFLFVQPVKFKKVKTGYSDYENLATAIKLTLFNYMSEEVIDEKTINISRNESGRVSNPVVFNLYNYFHISTGEYFDESMYVMDERVINYKNYSQESKKLNKLVKDDKLWFTSYSDDFYGKYNNNSPGYSSEQSIVFGYIDSKGIKDVYEINYDETANREMFEFFAPQRSSELGQSDYLIDKYKYYTLNTNGFRDENIDKKLKINNGLLQVADPFGSVYVFNLEKGGIRERKIPSLKIKNNQLSEEEKTYLSQFIF